MDHITFIIWISHRLFCMLFNIALLVLLKWKQAISYLPSFTFYLQNWVYRLYTVQACTLYSGTQSITCAHKLCSHTYVKQQDYTPGMIPGWGGIRDPNPKLPGTNNYLNRKLSAQFAVELHDWRHMIEHKQGLIEQVIGACGTGPPHTHIHTRTHRYIQNIYSIETHNAQLPWLPRMIQYIFSSKSKQFKLLTYLNLSSSCARSGLELNYFKLLGEL